MNQNELIAILAIKTGKNKIKVAEFLGVLISVIKENITNDDIIKLLCSALSPSSSGLPTKHITRQSKKISLYQPRKQSPSNIAQH